MPAHRSRGVAARAARQASSRSLPHDDRAGHQLAVDGAVVLVRAGSIKPDRIRPAPGHGAAAREARRADGLDAVRQRSGPGPGDGATDRDGIDGRIRAPVVATHELDAGASGQFVSGHNGSTNAAVDTIAIGGTVTWTWTGSLPHSVQSVGSPSFASSSTMTGSGSYAVRFDAPGIYQYDCALHDQLMTDTIVAR